MQQTQLAQAIWLLIILHIVFYLALKVLKIKTKNNILCCGLFGFSGAGDLNIIKMLGYFNDTRGGDGCGYYHDGNLSKGFGKTEDFKDHVLHHPIVLNPEASVFIGHTRKASYISQVSEKNTHPFLIDESFIFAHNGRIDNITDLVKYYGIDDTDMTVDSHKFGAIIKRSYPTKKMDVLSRYKGYAAISFMNADKPDEVYLYHGASKELSSGEMQEERPLFVLKTKDCMYWSSIRESLEFVKKPEESIAALDTNVLYRLEKGKLYKTKVKIEREFNNCYNYLPIEKEFKVFTPVTHHTTNHPAVILTRDDFESDENTTPYQREYNHKSRMFQSPSQKVPDNFKSILNIHSEYKPKEILDQIGKFSDRQSDIIYFHQGRHCVLKPNGTFHLADGVYYADKDSREGALYEEQYSDVSKGTEVTHFVKEIEYGTKRCCFFRGIFLNNNTLREFEEAFMDDSHDLHDDGVKGIKALSEFSRYPITSLDPKEKQWFHYGKPANADPIKPQFTDRSYTILKGFLVDIKDLKSKVPLDELIVSAKKSNVSDLPIKGNDEKPAIPLLPSTKIEGHKNEKTYQAKKLEIINTAKQLVEGKDYQKIQMSPLMAQCDTTFTSLSDLHSSVSIHVENALQDYYFDLVNSIAPDTDMVNKEHAENLLQEFYLERVETKTSIMSAFSGEHMSLLIDYLKINLSKFNAENKVDDDEVLDNSEELTLQALAQEDEENADVYIGLLTEEIGQVGSLSSTADELQTLQGSDYAQEVAAVLYKADGVLKAGLKEVFQKYNKKENLKVILDSEKNN